MEAEIKCENTCSLLDSKLDFVLEDRSDQGTNNGKEFNAEDNITCVTDQQEMCERLEKFTSNDDGIPYEVDATREMESNISTPSTGELNINEIFPEETWMTILLYCDVKDIISFGLTSKLAMKQFIEKPSNYFWKLKFFDLLKQRRCIVDDYKHLQHLELDKFQYREICFRFARIYETGSIGGEEAAAAADLAKCRQCGRFTCLQGCAEEGPQKVAVDIGSKLTWVISPTSELKRHQTILGVPKVVKCLDCDSITKHVGLPRKIVCNCHIPNEDTELSQLRSNRFTYSSQELSDELNTCCLFCNHRVYVRDSKENHLMRGYCEEAVEIESGSTSPEMEALCSGFCADAASQMKLRSLDFVSPALALRSGGNGLNVATAFLQHVLSQCHVLDGLRKPRGILVLCENVEWPSQVRHELLSFLFTQLKISRVCLVPRPLAVCAELGLKTAVVVDSGALHTAVSVVIGGRVILSRCKEFSIGGRHIAESLHCAHACDDVSQEIPVSSLDSGDVKEQCWLSYNMATEEQRECTVRCESIWVPAPNRRNMRIKSWKQISLGNEVFRAPEYMYVQLGLPRIIIEVTQGLPLEQLRECLSHIALTGGNTCLIGFEQRLRRDLVDLLPEHEEIIELVRGLGSRSCDAAVGATFIPFPMKPDGIPPGPPEAGTPCWISRDDYIIYGEDCL